MLSVILSVAVAVQAASPAIAALFRPDMLNANRAYVESRTGPAKYVSGTTRTYDVGGCTVEIDYSGDAVRTLALIGLSNHCTFDVSPFFPGRKVGSASDLTFGKFSSAFGRVEYLPECLGSCGNSADPAMTAYYAGTHSEQFYEIQVSNNYPYRGASADSAFGVLLAAAEAKLGSNVLYKADCDPAIVARAPSAFATVPIKDIIIGSELNADPARCDR